MTEKLKPSRYNHFVDIGKSKRLAFNALSCGLGEMDDENYHKYLQLTGNNGNSDCENCEELLKDLKKGGFLIPEEVDELDSIRAGHYKKRFGSNGFGLTIIPTYNCNFACDYCYENSDLHSMSPKEGSVMSDEVIENIVKLCEKEIPEKSAFTVTWYGGEPLMGKKVIEKLTKEFLRICKEKESQYHAGMITNGYLLNKKTLDFILKMKVSFIQVTIDGTKDIHDKRRCLKGGGGSYDRIMENLSHIKEDTPLIVSIRVNVDKRNENNVPELLEDFKTRNFHQRKNISVYFSQTVHYSNSCSNISSQCMVTQEYSEWMVDAYHNALESGFKISIYPATQLGNCGAISTGSAVIEPNGSVQTCWNSVGIEDEKTGQLTSKGIEYTNEYIKWLGWTPFIEKCNDCSILPLCMGGCPYKTIYENGDNICVWWKFNLKPMLEIAQKAKQKNLLVVNREQSQRKEVSNELVS